MVRKQLPAGLLLIAVCATLLLQPAFAAVELVYFRATAQADSTIKVEWQTATEMDVLAFRVYRSEAEFPADWGSPITEQPHQGDSIIGATYAYTDTAVVEGVKYWYLLEEVTSTGVAVVDKTSAGINLPTDTPTTTATTTTTATATLRPSATWTSQVFTGVTPTKPAPTATQKYTNTPVISPLGTPTRPPATNVPPVRPPTQTPLPLARVSTPTGRVPVVTAPVAALPTVVSVLPTPIPAATAIVPTKVATIAGSDLIATATPVPPKEGTPVIFVAKTEPDPSPSPEETGSVAAEGSRSTSMALVIGGSAVGLAAILVATLLFLRSRKS